MDLRTIMNNDSAGASKPPPTQSRQSPQASSHSDYQQHLQHAPPSSYPPGYPGRPAQPPSLQPLHTSPDPNSYGSVQSPYQYNSTSTLSAHSQHAQSPHAQTPYAAASRDSYSSAYTHPQQQSQSAGVLASPYTPQPMSAGIQPAEQQSYFAPKRSQSIQSVATPYGPSSYSLHSRDSPLSGPSQSARSHQFSPPAQGSLPGTPIRPPAVPYPHQSPSGRPQSSSHDSQPRQLSSPWTGRDSHPPDQRNVISPNVPPHYSHQDAKQAGQDARHYSGGPQRERSESVSPKTIAASGQRQESAEAMDYTGASHLNHVGDRRLKESPSGSIPQAGVNHGAQHRYPSPGAPQVNSPSPRFVSSDCAASEEPKPIPSKMDAVPGPRTGSSPHPPQRKRRRYDEQPIYAQRSAHAKGKGPVISNRRPPVPKHMRNSAQNPWLSSKRSSSANAPPSTPGPTASTSQPEDGTPVNGPPAPEPPQVGALGPWEPSIAGFIPHEEVTKLVCDFLFQHVVIRDDVAAAPAGSAAPGHGAIIEVEGKIGHLIDMERGGRLHLPILTESIINRDNPRFRTSFESSMTLVSLSTLHQ